MTAPRLTVGVSLKPEHFAAALACRDDGMWFEVHAENYLVDGGPRLAWLRAIRGVHPVSLHGVSASLGSGAPPDPAHVRALARLSERIEPALLSEHLAWSRWGGTYVPDLLPVARTDAALARICRNVDRLQQSLRRQVLIENPAHYLRGLRHDWGEADFLTQIAKRTGCGLLLDVNNVFVSARNLGFCASDYIDAIPSSLVAQVHLAGHSIDPQWGESLLVDSHDAAIATGVLDLYARLVRRIGMRPTLIERDGNLPSFERLLEEAEAVRRIAGVAARTRESSSPLTEPAS